MVTRHSVVPQTIYWRLFHCSPHLKGEADARETGTHPRRHWVQSTEVVDMACQVRLSVRFFVRCTGLPTAWCGQVNPCSACLSLVGSYPCYKGNRVSIFGHKTSSRVPHHDLVLPHSGFEGLGLLLPLRRLEGGMNCTVSWIIGSLKAGLSSELQSVSSPMPNYWQWLSSQRAIYEKEKGLEEKKM